MPDKPDAPVLGGLLGLLAHDLRNPLSALHSNLGYLHQVIPASSGDAQEAIDDGIVSCDALAHIIDNVELLGRMLQGEEAADRKSIDVSSVIAEVLASVDSMARSHGVHVAAAPEALREAMATAARASLVRALGNLVRNAIQHSPAGATVRVSLVSRPHQVAVVVTDGGSSLAGAVGEAVFTAHGQLASKSVPNGRYSRGLGLYSAAIAAAAAGAAVRIVATEGAAGNAFELAVPRST